MTEEKTVTIKVNIDNKEVQDFVDMLKALLDIYKEENKKLKAEIEDLKKTQVKVYITNNE